MLHCLKHKSFTVQMKSFNLFMALILYFSLPTLSLGSRRRVHQKENGKSFDSASWSPPLKISEVSITTSSEPPVYPYFLSNGQQEQFWNLNQTDSFSGVSTNTNSFNNLDNRQPEATSVIQSYDINPYATKVDSYFPENYHGHGHHHHYSGYEYEDHNSHKPEFEIEDKLFTKTIAATKVLKAGKAVFTLCMILVVLVLAGLGQAGVALSPAALPLALLPIGFIALILFVPLFLLYVPIVATGHAGGERRRRKRNVGLIGENEFGIAEIEQYFSSLERNIFTLVEKIN